MAARRSALRRRCQGVLAADGDARRPGRTARRRTLRRRLSGRRPGWRLHRETRRIFALEGPLHPFAMRGVTDRAAQGHRGADHRPYPHRVGSLGSGQPAGKAGGDDCSASGERTARKATRADLADLWHRPDADRLHPARRTDPRWLVPPRPRGLKRVMDDCGATTPAPSGLLWIASYPKSGNTWTRAFLNNLLKIIQNDDEGAPQSINQMTEYTLWDISAKPYERHLGKPVTDVDRAEIARIRPLVQAEIAEDTEGLAMVKTHHALVSDRGVPAINFAVTSGAIYIVRNPLDVAVSFAHHLGTDVDYAIEEMALRNKETGVTDKSVYEIYGSWSQHVESWTRTRHRAIHVMRYEDMLVDPAAA